MTTTAPMLATEAPLPSGPDWGFEVKWDGVRALVDVTEGQVRARARSGRDITGGYPELTGLGDALDDALLDGELVVLQRGIPSFSALAARMHVRDPDRAAQLAAFTPVVFMVFDVLRLYGVDLTRRPLRERRATLERTGLGSDAAQRSWQLSPVYDDGDALLTATAEQGLEGVVAKRLTSTYRPGVRSRDWVKVPHRRTESFVVGGWRPEIGSAGRIGALLVGAVDTDGAVHLTARVGSGLTAATIAELTGRIAARPDSPFAEPVPRLDADTARWCDPTVVVDVRFLTRGDSGRLRQPVFRGLRDDLTIDDLKPDDLAPERQD